MPSKSFKNYINKVFVETGSHVGLGIDLAIESGFQKIYSIELSDKYHNYCVEKFKGNDKVILIKGDAEIELEKIINSIETEITFWLDGHYSGDDTACGLHEDPIMQELDVIENHKIKTHTILIDDMRGYDRKLIEERVLKINPKYNITYDDGYVKDDILVARILN